MPESSHVQAALKDDTEAGERLPGKIASMQCRVCEAESRHEFSQTILGRYPCDYFFCSACGFLQTEQPYWLNEAYESAIASADTGLVFRNIFLSRVVAALLFFMLKPRGKYLDAAGGYGMLTRLMRDLGMDFYWSDLYCQNLLARGFERETTSAPFDAVTAFEVMEHLPEPLLFLQETLAQAKTRTIIFSTELYADTPPRPDDWWYYSFQTGQHIAFYQKRTLQMLAAKLGLQCYSSGMIHMMTDRVVSPMVFRFLTHPRLSAWAAQVPKKMLTSKMVTDNHVVLARMAAAEPEPRR